MATRFGIFAMTSAAIAYQAYRITREKTIDTCYEEMVCFPYKKYKDVRFTDVQTAAKKALETHTGLYPEEAYFSVMRNKPCTSSFFNTDEIERCEDTKNVLVRRLIQRLQKKKEELPDQIHVEKEAPTADRITLRWDNLCDRISQLTKFSSARIEEVRQAPTALKDAQQIHREANALRFEVCQKMEQFRSEQRRFPTASER